jgi:hypothetical protein
MIIEKYKLKPNFSALSRKFHVDCRTTIKAIINIKQELENQKSIHYTGGDKK